jgi:kynurenine formamidase
MPLENFKVIELTHTLSPNSPTWNGSCGFCLEIKKNYEHVFRVQQIKMHAGIGTHIDAPSHRFQGAPSISDIPLEQLIVPACVIDVSKKADKDYVISVEDVQEYEKTYGPIPPRCLVIGYTGWDRFFSDSKQYRNIDAEGQMHFPAFGAETTALLLERKISGIAIDTLSPDCLDPSFPVHQLILGAGQYIIENIANCAALPPRGASVIALPIKLQDATEAPARIIGLIPLGNSTTRAERLSVEPAS